MKRNKLGATYNVFNGEELLKRSIENIRDCVDYINVVWQRTSWTGNQANPELEKMLNDMKEEGLVDNLIEFTFDPGKASKYHRKMRCNKMNLGIKDLIKSRCTHFILMDADEFYRKNEFCEARDYIYKYRITHSACSIYDYRVLPIYREKEARDYSVGFIFKLHLYSRVIARSRINNVPVFVDPYRTVPFVYPLHRFYYLNMISMHHMTGVRRDYQNKLDNSESNLSCSGKKAIEKYGKLQERLQRLNEKELLEQGYIKVQDEFGLMNYEKDN